MIVAGRNPDLTALQLLPFLAFPHLEPGEGIETLGEQARKQGGMCCTITMGTGKSAGNCGSSAVSAFGPPVDVPMATTSIRACGLAEARAGNAGAGRRPRHRAPRTRT